jgi:simple sugar transport system permease protein
MAEVFLLSVLALDATLRVASPLVLASLAGLFAERSGIVDIGLEGKMLGSAFAAAAAAAVTGSVWLGLTAGIGTSVALALLHGFACITHRGNHVVSGVAINILTAGLTVTLAISWFGQGGHTPPLPDGARFTALVWPGAQALAGIPVFGTLYSELLSGHNILVYVTFLAVPLTWWVVYRTRFGLRLRAVGEHPEAVDSVGISVAGLRYRAMICCGVLCGIAGSYLSTAQNLAALIFGKWRPVPAMLACLLFGFLDAVAARLQGVELPVVGAIPVQFIQALPYVLTVVLLAGFIGKAVAPRASGEPYVKER